MSLSAGLFPRDHGLSLLHSLTPSLLSLRHARFPTSMTLFSAPPHQPQEDALTLGQASTSSGSKPPETFIRNKDDAQHKNGNKNTGNSRRFLLPMRQATWFPGAHGSPSSTDFFSLLAARSCAAGMGSHGLGLWDCCAQSSGVTVVVSSGGCARDTSSASS